MTFTSQFIILPVLIHDRHLQDLIGENAPEETLPIRIKAESIYEYRPNTYNPNETIISYGNQEAVLDMSVQEFERVVEEWEKNKKNHQQ